MAIKTTLLDIGEDDQQIGTTKHEAKSLASSMETALRNRKKQKEETALVRNSTYVSFMECHIYAL